MTQLDDSMATTLNDVYRLYGQRAEQRAEYYMKRHPDMSEAEACQAAVCWAKNMAQQQRRRKGHGTGAH